MVLEQQAPKTLAAFEAFVRRAENLDKHLEWINGEVVEVPSNPYVSVIASRIITFINMFLMRENGLSGYVSGEGGGFVIEGQVFAPDVAYMASLPTDQGFEPSPPLLAVEVISDPHSNTEQGQLRRKLMYYQRAEVLVWIVDYMARQVEVHTPNESSYILGNDDRLTGGKVLPSFELPVKDIFPEEDASQ